MARVLKPCGTAAAYDRHLYHGETPCDACVQANRDDSKQRREVNGERLRRMQRARLRATSRLRNAHRAEYRRQYMEELRSS